LSSNDDDDDDDEFVNLKKKKEYDSKVAKALKIFHDRIGPKAYDHQIV